MRVSSLCGLVYGLIAALVVTGVSWSAAPEKASDSTKRTIAQFFAHPIFEESYNCTEHPAGALGYVGDDLGQDCLIQEFVADGDRTFLRTFATDGRKNEDWFGWNKVVVAPCDCTVVDVSINPVDNQPGRLGNSPASHIELKNADGAHITLAHIQAPIVKAGDVVKAGQPIARVGNNGVARVPHIHVGAWRGNDALQIRWDQQQMPVR